MARRSARNRLLTHPHARCVRAPPRTFVQSAIFNFQALLIVILLTICTCAYLRANFPSIIDRNKTGYCGVWVLLFSKEWSMSCVCMGSACLCPHCRACLLCISVRPRERSMGIY